MPLKSFSNFWIALKMSLIICEIRLNLTWPKNCVISSAKEATEFAITDNFIN